MAARPQSAYEPAPGDAGRLAVLRWGGAAAVVLAAHTAAAVALLGSAPEPPPEGTPQAPILIDLAPPAAAPEIASSDAPTGPEPVEDVSDEPEPEPEPPVPPEPEPEPEEPEPEIVEPKPEPAQPPEPVVEEPEPEPVDLPEPQPEAEAVLNVPLPTARPDPPPRRQVEREERRREEPRRRAEPRREEPRQAEAPRRQQRQAPPPSAASQGRQQQQASQGARSAPSVSPARWQSQVQARLNRFKRPPRGGGRGTAQVSFTITGSGAAGGVRLARSSGNAALDQAALQLVQRASPFPAPPGGGSVSLVVPIRYD